MILIIIISLKISIDEHLNEQGRQRLYGKQLIPCTTFFLTESVSSYTQIEFNGKAGSTCPTARAKKAFGLDPRDNFWTSCKNRLPAKVWYYWSQPKRVAKIGFANALLNVNIHASVKKFQVIGSMK